MLENSHVLDGSAKRKAIPEHVSATSKEHDELAEQLLQSDDDILNESDIAIKQGSHNKSVQKGMCNSLDCKSRYIVSSYCQI